MAWLTGYTYRKKITITGQTGAGTNYQVKLQIGNVSGGDFNLSNHSLSFPNDIRFTSSDGSTQLAYWIENLASAPITVWIKVTNSLETNADIYCYYGKISDTTTSNGTNTFILFDDFTSNTIGSKWTEAICYGAGSYPATHTIENGGYHIISNNDHGVDLTAISTLPSSVVAQVTLSYTGWTGRSPPWSYFGMDFLGGAKYLQYTFGYWGSAYALNPSNPSDNLILKWTDGTITNNVNIYRNNISVVTGSTDFGTSHKPSFGLRTAGSEAINAYYKNFFAYKYAATEPTFSTVGTEELGITATLMTISQSENPCRTGICTITATVTWQNLGNSSVTFRPTILIDGVTYVQAASDTTIVGAYPATSSPIQITTPTLSAGIHTICPDPN